MAKRKKIIDVPESVCLFTPEEINYINKASKMIPWPVDVQLAQINVPFGSEQEAEEQLTVRHLVNKFSFVVQSTIHCEVKKVFDPEMKSKEVIPHEEPLMEVGEIKRGTKINNTRENRTERIFGETKTDWIMCIIGTMQPNYHIKKDTLDIGVKHGIFKIIV